MSRWMGRLDKIPRRVAFIACAALLVVAGLMAVLVAGPVVRDLRRQAELSVLRQFEQKKGEVELIVADTLRVASRYSSLKMSLASSSPGTGQGWHPLPKDWGVTTVPEIAKVDMGRLVGVVHENGRVVAVPSLQGRTLPVAASAPAAMIGGNHRPVIDRMLYVEGEFCLAVVVPGLGRQEADRQLDVVVCRAPDMEKAFRETGSIGSSARLWLVDAGGESLRWLSPTSAAGDLAPVGGQIRQALELARFSARRPLAFAEYAEGRLAVAYLRLPETRLGLVLTMDSRELYGSTNYRLAALGTGLLALMVFGGSLVYAGVRPLVGRLDGVVGGVRREEELRQVEWRRERQQRRQCETGFAEFLAAAPVGILQASPDGRLLAANPSAASLFGYPSGTQLVEAVNSAGWRRVICADPLLHPSSAGGAVAEAGEPLAGQSECRRRDGSSWMAEFRLLALSTPPVVYVFMHDVTAWQDAEKALDERQDFERLLAEMAAGLAASEDGTVEGAVERELARLAVFLGGEMGLLVELQARRLADAWFVCHGGGQLAEMGRSEFLTAAPELVRQWQEWGFVYLHDLASDPEFLDAASRDFLLRHGVGSLACLAFDNIDGRRWAIGVGRLEKGLTWSKAVQRRLLVAGARLAEYVCQGRLAMEAGRLKMAMAHAARVNTAGRLAGPALQEASQWLAAARDHGARAVAGLNQGEENVWEAREAVVETLASVGAAVSTLEQLRDQLASRPLTIEAVAVGEAINNAVRLVRGAANRHGIGMQVKQVDGLPPVRAARVNLQHVLIVLLNNAIEAIRQADAKEGGMVLVAARLEAGGRLAITVDDSGPGVSATDLQRLFELFFTTKTDGLGLGLATCRTMLAEFGAEIDASHSPSGGMTFRVSLEVAT